MIGKFRDVLYYGAKENSEVAEKPRLAMGKRGAKTASDGSWEVSQSDISSRAGAKRWGKAWK